MLQIEGITKEMNERISCHMKANFERYFQSMVKDHKSTIELTIQALPGDPVIDALLLSFESSCFCALGMAYTLDAITYVEYTENMHKVDSVLEELRKKNIKPE